MFYESQLKGIYASLIPGRPINTIGVACDAHIAVGQWWAVRETLRCYLPLPSQFWYKYTAVWVILEGL